MIALAAVRPATAVAGEGCSPVPSVPSLHGADLRRDYFAGRKATRPPADVRSMVEAVAEIVKFTS